MICTCGFSANPKWVTLNWRASCAVPASPGTTSISAIHANSFDNAMSQCEAFGLSPAQAVSEVSAVIDVVNDWREHFVQTGVTARDIDSLAQHIDGDTLRKQRAEFSRVQFPSTPIRKRRASPFRGS